MLYRVECIDRDTGQRFEVRVEAVSPAAAAKVAMRDGVVVGQVLTAPNETSPVLTRPAATGHEHPHQRSPLLDRPIRTIGLGIWLGHMLVAATGLVALLLFWLVTAVLLAGVLASCPRPTPPGAKPPQNSR